MSGFPTLAQDSLQINSDQIAQVETEASYPGGDMGWRQFLEKNLNSGVPGQNNAPIGKYTAAVLFIVDKDGSVSDVKPVTKFGYGMEEEVVRVILKSGKWAPAIQNGKPVRAYRKQPVTFLLDTDVFNISTKLPYTLFTNMDNEMTVMAKKVKAEDIGINVPGAKVSRVSDGKFNVRVSKPGRVTIEIVNIKKDDKEIGVASFEVKAN